ncbi:MAG: PepSY domain-containing protein [Cellvibrionaceae bacterium]
MHKYLGLALLLPLIGWVLTGIVFLTKPGYEGAYEKLVIKKYPINSDVNISSNQNWDEVKIVKSILGIHYLVQDDGKSKHIDPSDYQEAKLPSRDEIELLVKDTIQSNSERYGKIEKIDGLIIYTSTGVKIVLDWSELSLRQYGNDRRVIDTLYKIHYLQWTPWDILNRLLGVVGLFLLAMLTIFGLLLFIKSFRNNN